MPRRCHALLILLSCFAAVICTGLQLTTPVSTQQHESLSAQSSVGSLSGTVFTSGNTPINNVRIDLTPAVGITGSTLSTYSGPDGTFVFSQLPYGRYILTATLGLAGASEDIVVSSGAASVNIGIDLGASSKGATVSVAELTVPRKASKALEKAKQAARNNRLEVADRYIAQALLVWPHYCQALTLRATLALSRNSYEQARSDSEKAVEYDPNNGMAYMVLGDSYLSLNRLDDAMRAIDRSINISPNAWQGYYEKGKILLIHHDWAGTIQQATKAASLKTEDDPSLHLLKAFAFAGMKDQHAAKNEVDAFRRLKPESSWSPQTRKQLNAIEMSATGSSSDPTFSGSGHAASP